jgi:hypothetical protein
MMVRQAILGCVSLALAASCATTSTNQNANGQTAQQMRRRPRRRDVQRALSDAVRRAAECLPRSAPNVTVTGAFHGETGEFRVENIESETPLGTTVRTCVREEFESAHVAAFADERYESVRVFTAEGAVLAAQNGSGALSSVAPSNATATSATSVSSAPPDTLSQSAGSSQPATNTSATPATATTASATNAAGTATTATPENGSSAATATNASNVASTATATNTTAASNGAHPPVAPNDAGPLPTNVVANCYTSILRVNPAIGGRLRVRFEITADGAARNVSAYAMGTPTGPLTLFNNAARCVEQRVRGYSFAHSASGRADLVIAMTPSAHGGNVSIERRSGGLLAVAPGLEAVPTDNAAAATSTATTPTQTPTQPASGSWNDVSGTSAYNRQIAESVRARVGEIRACYQGQLTRSPELALRTRVRFTIEAAGSVPIASSTTVVTSGDADAASTVAQCVEAVVRATNFPARAGATAMETSLPFTFSPGPGTAASNATTTAPAPMPTGRIDPNATSMVIRQHTDQVRSCYTRALRMNPSLAGRVLVRFTVDPTGRVIAPSSQITPIAGDRAALGSVAMCIEQVLQSVPLPPPTGGPASVALPFDFTPNTP